MDLPALGPGLAHRSDEHSGALTPQELVGPLLVIIGASMWGLETFWRVRLLKVFNPDILVFHEHWLGLVLTSPFLIAGWRSLRGVSRKAWLSMLASGVLGSALGTVCFSEALALMNPSLANLLLNVQPIISVLVAWFWLRERPRPSFYPWAAAALLCGLALAWSPGGSSSGNLPLGLLCIAGTAFCWGASTTFGRGAMLEIDFKTAVTLRYFIGMVATGVIAGLNGSLSTRLNWSALATTAVWHDMAALLVVAAITPTFIYFAGLARTRASVATFAEMAQTFASLIITWGVLGDALTLTQTVAGVVLLVAVVFINRSVTELNPDRFVPSMPAAP